MRIYSAYISRLAAKNANSVFEPKRLVKKIYKDGESLWHLAEQEESDDGMIDSAEQHAAIPNIAEREKNEIKDIESLVNETFRIVRDAVILIHTQLAELKKLVEENEVLKQSGFPIEVADQIEEMLKKEIANIVSHLREMAADIQSEDNNDSKA